ncbi:MAG: deoxyguanosinetriphosphate triphosphohydrolase [Deltaproteobacteria bacterium]|nr:MAG: deoxyguanosinetriphosphate triphosphohydrolase [Deltaproteobacteria bacterium]
MSAIRTREHFEKEECERLAPFALRSVESRGRVVPEPEHPYRTAYQRDRDRIVHSRAFRRLEYKTQVFIYHEGDHYRNRLTHTLEGAQVARTISRALRLNEDLAEAIVLAHDLGHTPFGHAGERALNRVMREVGGFDHNRQSLRAVDLLEERYPGFRGLNLTYETREGIVKHGRSWEHAVPLPPETRQPGLEAQLADVSDEIAYTSHDLDDGLRSGLLGMEQLDTEPYWRALRADARRRLGPVSDSVLNAQTVLALLNQLVTDLVEATAERLTAAGLRSAEEVRNARRRFVRFSKEMERRFLHLKRFLRKNLYHHPEVTRMSREAERVVADLYRIYSEDPARLPPQVPDRFDTDGRARAIADYIAGMTDRFALAEHRRLRDSDAPA